jgi:hypothetical protein
VPIYRRPEELPLDIPAPLLVSLLPVLFEAPEPVELPTVLPPCELDALPLTLDPVVPPMFVLDEPDPPVPPVAEPDPPAVAPAEPPPAPPAPPPAPCAKTSVELSAKIDASAIVLSFIRSFLPGCSCD